MKDIRYQTKLIESKLPIQIFSQTSSIRFKKILTKHSKMTDTILKECDSEQVNSWNDILQKNLFDLFVEDLKKEKFDMTCEFIQKLEGIHSNYIRKLFYQMKDSVIVEKQEAEITRQEYRSGISDPNRRVAVFELILSSKRFKGGDC